MSYISFSTWPRRATMPQGDSDFPQGDTPTCRLWVLRTTSLALHSSKRATPKPLYCMHNQTQRFLETLARARKASGPCCVQFRRPIFLRVHVFQFAYSTRDLARPTRVTLRRPVFLKMHVFEFADSTRDLAQTGCVSLRRPAFLKMLVFEFRGQYKGFGVGLFAFHCAGQHF